MTTREEEYLKKYYDNKLGLTVLDKVTLLGIVSKNFYRNHNSIVDYARDIDNIEINTNLSIATFNSMLTDVVNFMFCPTAVAKINIETMYKLFDSSVCNDDTIKSNKVRVKIGKIYNDNQIFNNNAEIELLIKNLDVDFLINLYVALYRVFENR